MAMKAVRLITLKYSEAEFKLSNLVNEKLPRTKLNRQGKI
jgi:hypothetical protein